MPDVRASRHAAVLAALIAGDVDVGVARAVRAAAQGSSATALAAPLA